MEQIKQYGKIGLITHLTLSWTFLGVTYLVVRKSKQTDRIIKYLKLENKIPKQAGAFAIAGIIYKAVMPVRIGVSIITIPILVKTFNLDVGSVQK